MSQVLPNTNQQALMLFARGPELIQNTIDELEKLISYKQHLLELEKEDLWAVQYIIESYRGKAIFAMPFGTTEGSFRVFRIGYGPTAWVCLDHKKDVYRVYVADDISLPEDVAALPSTTNSWRQASPTTWKSS